MATLEERVAVLETRVDEIAAGNAHSDELAVAAMREALASREAHMQNSALLNALRETQAEHSQILAEHSQILAEHSQVLTEHTRRFDGIDRLLGILPVGVHDIQLSIGELIRRTPPDDELSSGQGATG